MTPRDALEKEARELYKVIVSAMKPETPRYTEIGEQIAEFQFVQGYLAAATARNKEIEELRARVKELAGMVPRWCGVQGLDRLRALGWHVAVANWQDKPPMWLMVPPIPLPEGK